MKIKFQHLSKTIITSHLVVFVIIFSVSLVANLTVGTHHSSAANYTNCTEDAFYDCPQEWAKYEAYITSWCSKADANKKEACEFTTWGYTDFAPKGTDNRTIPNPPFCRPGSAGYNPDDPKMDKGCWVGIKAGKFYDLSKEFQEDCVSDGIVDSECAKGFYEQWALDNKWTSNDPNSGAVGGGAGKKYTTAAQQTPFVMRVATYMRWLFVGIGVLAAFGVVLAGIQYAAAQDNPQAIAAAKGRITNIVIGIAIYFFMFAALQWLVPGGIF